MKLYIAGKITGDDHYIDKFQRAALEIIREGHLAVSPSCLPFGLEHREYMHICKAMIDVSDGVYFLKDWRDSDGALSEYGYAVGVGKRIFFQDIRTAPDKHKTEVSNA